MNKEELKKEFNELKKRQKHLILTELIQARNRNNVTISYIDSQIKKLKEKINDLESYIDKSVPRFDDKNYVNAWTINFLNNNLHDLEFIKENLLIIKECL